MEMSQIVTMPLSRKKGPNIWVENSTKEEKKGKVLIARRCSAMFVIIRPLLI